MGRVRRRRAHLRRSWVCAGRDEGAACEDAPRTQVGADRRAPIRAAARILHGPRERPPLHHQNLMRVRRWWRFANTRSLRGWTCARGSSVHPRPAPTECRGRGHRSTLRPVPRSTIERARGGAGQGYCGRPSRRSRLSSIAAARAIGALAAMWPSGRTSSSSGGRTAYSRYIAPSMSWCASLAAESTV